MRTWKHSRKGTIVGEVVWEDEEWMDIELAGHQDLAYASRTLDGKHSDGEIIRVRKSFCTEQA